MTCAEFKEQVDAWVLGALEPAEAAACEAHLAESAPHDGCQEALARARETLAALGRTHPPETPDPRVWRSIESAIGDARPAAAPARARSRWRDPFVWAAAAALLVAAGLGAWGRHQRDLLFRTKAAFSAALSASKQREMNADTARTACLRELAGAKNTAQLEREALALLEDPATRVVPFAPQTAGGYKASAIVNAASKRVVVLSSGLPARPNSDFELWVVPGTGAPRPAGFLKARPDGTAIGEIDRRLLAEGADTFAVSVEPTGGRPTPTTVILVAKVPS